MNKIRILHCADFHLDSTLPTLGAVSKLRCQELLISFGRVMEVAKSECVDAVIISGDLFDKNDILNTSYNYVVGKLNEIIEIPVFISLGNHDYSFDMPLPENVHIFKDQIEKVSIGDADIYGISFADRYINQCNIEGFVADDTNKINVFAIHTDLISNGQKSVYNPLTVSDMADTGVDYFALGHVHKFSGIQKINNTTYAYPGIPEGRGFDELGKKGVIIADVYKNHVDAKFIPICQRQYLDLEIDISNLNDYGAVINLIENAAAEKNDLYKITLIGETEMIVNTSLILNMLSDKYFYLKVADETKPKIDIEEVSKEHSLKGLFVKNAFGNKTALKYGLAALSGEKVPLP